MISLILNRKNVPYLIIATLLIYIFLTSRSESVEVVIPSERSSIEVLEPTSVKRFDTIYRDRIVREEILKIVEVENPINKELLERYEKAIKEKDSAGQIELYMSAVKERKYLEKLEDSVQIITVESEVIGTLKRQVISYETKPRTVTLQPKRRERPHVYIGAMVGREDMSTLGISSYYYGAEAQIVGSKKYFSVGYDSRKNIKIGIGIKLF